MAQLLLDDSGDPQTDAPIVLTRDEIERWAGRKLTGPEMQRLAAAIPFSSIPEAVSTIVASWETWPPHDPVLCGDDGQPCGCPCFECN